MIGYVIARNTFREATRDRVLTGLLIGGLVLIAGTQVLSPLAMGEEIRLTTDLGLTVISFLGMLLIVMVGTNLVAKELERRTIYNLLSRPIPRWVYLVGKWAGLTGTLWLVSGVLGVGLVALLVLTGNAGHGPAVLQATYMAGLELSVMTAVAVLFSSFTTPVLSALYTLAIFAVGQWSYDLREFAEQFPPTLGTVVQFLANVVPNLPLFNMRTLATEAAMASPQHVLFATLYAAVYCACALTAAAAVFERRDFK